MILHLPHASTLIPKNLRQDFLLSDQELREELNRITDHASDAIFQWAFPKANAIVFPVSRLVVDPERFSDDSQEPMSQVGMGVTYYASVHDAVLIEAPLDELENRVQQAQELMLEASRQVLGGFELTTDADIYRYPERYRDEERGGKFWDKVMDLLLKTKLS